MLKTNILLAVVAVSLFLIPGCDNSGSKLSDNDERIPVEVKAVTLGNVVQYLNYHGDIKAEQEVKVFSKIPDRIEKFFVDESDTVRRGEPIARIVATTIEQGVRQAEAALIAAKAQAANLALEYERVQRLISEDAISKQQFDAVKTQYESVKAQVEQAEAALTSMRSQLNDATIIAPIPGIVGRRYYETGDMASPAQPVVSIVQMERVKIEINATEEDLGHLAIGEKATIKVKAYSVQIFDGKVAKISPVLNPDTRMARVEILVDNPDYLLKPGMYAEVEVTIGVLENVMVVPRYASIESTTLEKIAGQDQVVKNYYVFVVDSARAEQRKLEIAYINHRSMAVVGGIDVGDQLVVAGQNNLRDGVGVIIIKGEED